MTQKEPKELKEGLFLFEEEDDDKLKVMEFENRTSEKQFICKYTFKEASELKCGITTKQEGVKLILSVHPGERLELARGRWSGLTKSIAVGPVSKEWMEGDVRRQYKENHKYVNSALNNSNSPQHCIDTNTQFIDVEFPPIENSLQQTWQKGDLPKKYVFRRPSDWGIIRDLGKQPKLFVDGIEPEDINQGALADCALIAVITSIAQRKELVNFIFGENQHPEIGLYKLVMCKNGLWTVVVVDDYIPCHGGKPSFARNRNNPNELWISLLEKAYSKCLKSFSTLKSALCSYSFTDLTGCPNKNLIIEPNTECDDLRSDFKRGALIVLGTPGKNLMSSKAAKESDQLLWDKYRSVELICEHSYSVMGFEVDKGVIIVKMRNPWGTTVHGLWSGAYGPKDSTASHLYDRLSEEQKDGVFYMTWKDVTQWFNSCSVGYPLSDLENIHVPGVWDHQGACNKAIVCKVTNDIPHQGDPRLWVGFHQEDIRGIEGQEFKGINIFIVTPTSKGTRVRVVESVGTSKRDRFIPINIRDFQGKQLMIVGQPKDPSPGKYVISLHTSSLELLQIDFSGPIDDNLHYYKLGKEVSFNHWKPTETVYQVKGNKLSGGKILERCSHSLGEVSIESFRGGMDGEIDQSHNESLMEMNDSAPSSPIKSIRQTSISSANSSCRQSSLIADSPNVSIQNMSAVQNLPSVDTTPLEISPSELKATVITPPSQSLGSTPGGSSPDVSLQKLATPEPSPQKVIPADTTSQISHDKPEETSPVPPPPSVLESIKVADAEIVVVSEPKLVEEKYLSEPFIGELGNSSYATEELPPSQVMNINSENITPIDTTDDEEVIKVDITEGKHDESEDEIEFIPYSNKLPDSPPALPAFETRPPRKSFFESQKELQQHFTGEEKEIRLEVCNLIFFFSSSLFNHLM